MAEKGVYDEKFWEKIPLYNGHTTPIQDGGVYKIEGNDKYPRRLVITCFYPAFFDAAISTNIHAWFVFALAHGLCSKKRDFCEKLSKLEHGFSINTILGYMKEGEKEVWNGNLAHQFSKPISVLAFVKSLASALSQLTGQMVGMGDILGLPPAETDRAVLTSCMKKLGCSKADINTEELLSSCRDKERGLAIEIFNASLEAERKRLSQSEFVNYVNSLIDRFAKDLPGENLSDEESRFFQNARDAAEVEIYPGGRKQKSKEKQPAAERLECLLARYLMGSVIRISYEKANHLFKQMTELVRKEGMSFWEEPHMADSDFHAYGYEKTDGRWTFTGVLGQGALCKIQDNWRLWALLHGSAAVLEKNDSDINAIEGTFDFWGRLLLKKRMEWRESGQKSSLHWVYEPGLEEWMNHIEKGGTISAIWNHAGSEADLQDVFCEQELFLKNIMEEGKNKGKQLWSRLEQSYKDLWKELVRLVQQEREMVEGEADFRLDMEKKYPDAIPFLLDDYRSWGRADEKWESSFAGIPREGERLTCKQKESPWEGRESVLRQAAEFILRKEDVSYWWKKKTVNWEEQRGKKPLGFSTLNELFDEVLDVKLDSCPVSLSFPEKVRELLNAKEQESPEDKIKSEQYITRLFDYYRVPLKPYAFTGVEKKEWMLAKFLVFCLDNEPIKRYMGDFLPKAGDSRAMTGWIREVCNQARKGRTDTYTIELQEKDRTCGQVNNWADASLSGRVKGFQRNRYFSYLEDEDRKTFAPFEVSLMAGEPSAFAESGLVPWYHQFPEIKEVVFKADKLFFIHEGKQGTRELVVWDDKNGNVPVVVYQGQKDGAERKWAVSSTERDEILNPSGIEMSLRQHSFYYSIGIPLCSWIRRNGEKAQLVMLHGRVYSYDFAVEHSVGNILPMENISWEESSGGIDAYIEEIKKEGIPVRFTQVFGSIEKINEIYAYAENPRLEVHLDKDYCVLDL